MKKAEKHKNFEVQPSSKVRALTRRTDVRVICPGIGLLDFAVRKMIHLPENIVFSPEKWYN